MLFDGVDKIQLLVHRSLHYVQPACRHGGIHRLMFLISREQARFASALKYQATIGQFVVNTWLTVGQTRNTPE
jgi:hypothetical protein